MHPSWLRRASVFALVASLATGCATSLPPDAAGGGPRGRPDAASGAVRVADAGATARVALPDLGNDPDLRTFLRVALARNPRIRAARERASAAVAAEDAAGWLPDPMVTFGWYAESIETRVGPQRRSIGVRQPLPDPGKLALQSDLHAARGRRARLEYDRVTRDVLVDVIRGAHELLYIDRARRVSDDLAALLERAVVRSTAETDALLPETFRAETQRAQLVNDRVLLDELRVVEEQALRGLLDLPVDRAIGTPAIGPAPEVHVTLDELLSIAERHSQELSRAGIDVEIAEIESSLAARSRVPDLSLGVTRISTDRLDGELGMNPDGNGRDPVIVQLGATLPIWVGRDTAALRAARARERAAEWERADAVQSLRERVTRAWFRVRGADRLARLYDETLVPRAVLAARTAEDLLAAGKGSPMGVLETIAVHHNFQLAAARARADHGRAIAELERAIGRPFEGESEAESP